MKKTNTNKRFNTMIKNHQLTKFIEEFSGVINEHPKEFLTVNTQPSELTVTVAISDFFSIGYDEDKMKITVRKELPDEIKLKIFKLFDELILGVNEN